MSRLTITGCGVVSAAGVGRAALRDQLRDGARVPAVEIASRFAEPLPAETARAYADFDVRKELGRKGTSFYDRATAMAVVACGAALDDAAITVDDGNRGRIGLVLGTTLGSFKSTSDYSRDTLVQEKPYLVNPVLFPNSVMNCAAGQAAIRYGLRGVNSTVAGGALAFHHALRYAANALDRGYVDVMLVGAVEEFSPHRAWGTERAGARRSVSGAVGAAGEGAAVFVVERAAPACDTAAPAEILGTASGFGWGPAAPAALEGCVRRVLADTATAPADVTLVATGEAGEDDRSEYDAAVAALGHRPPRYAVSELLGECDAATGALAVAALLGDAATILLTARTPDGGVGAALLRTP